MAKRTFDWRGLEAAAINSMVNAVRQVHQQYPDEQIYAAMFHAFYGDGEQMSWPCIATGTEESLAQRVAYYQRELGYTTPAEALSEELRWSGADLPHCQEIDEEGERWADACQAFAAQDGTFSGWENVYNRFLHIFPKAAKKARKQLLDEGIVSKAFIAIAADEAEELVPLSLTKTQIARHFPRFDAEAVERQRIAGLPVDQQLAELVPQVVGSAPRGILYGDYEALLKPLGKAAVTPLCAVIRGEQPGDKWKASMLLAEINVSTDEATAALCLLLDDPAADESDRRWAAAALARLDQMACIAARVPALPLDIAAGGLAGPYRAFREDGHFRPLDYRPLEQVLEQFPQLEPALAQELAPGRGYCRITATEVAAARAGLASRWRVIREHAAAVLEAFEDKLG
ncbi:DUF4303 domain-containing protein [Kosakonia sp.]|uniref:DUF4303 domain-containing protein n=1 Tax=Kosakonia sp. TaxID=1916651 RepID=UPI0028993ACB|nr:DUF4303 domain-containing protein [Kosakonia sp.]